MLNSKLPQILLVIANIIAIGWVLSSIPPVSSTLSSIFGLPKQALDATLLNGQPASFYAKSSDTDDLSTRVDKLSAALDSLSSNIVTSINSLNGNLTISAGDNTAITSSDKTIQISSSGSGSGTSANQTTTSQSGVTSLTSGGGVTVNHSTGSIILGTSGIPYSSLNLTGKLVGSDLASNISVNTSGNILSSSTIFSNTSNSNLVTIQAGTTSSSYSLILPTSQASGTQFLQNDGSGNLSWAGGSGSGANTALSNLASVAINTSLLPSANNSIDLGDGTHQFRTGFFGTSLIFGTNGASQTALTFTAPTTARTITLPNASGTVAISASTPLSLDSAGNLTVSNATTGAVGVASFNGTNFTVTSGAVNTIQNINSAATPTFASATLTGTSSLTLGTTSSATGQLVLRNSTNGNTLTLQPGATGSALTWTLPTNNGTGSQFLQNNGSGVLSWASASGGSCSNCVLNDSSITSTTNTIAPTTDVVSLKIKQTSAVSPSSDIFDVTNSGASTSYISVNSTGKVGINVASAATTMEVSGALRLSGSTLDTWTTPGSASLNAKLNIATVDPGAFGTVLGLGIPSTAASNSRVILAADGRTVVHNPTIGLLSPDESQIAGLTWDGSNTTAYFKSSQQLGFKVGGGPTLALTFDTSGVASFTPGNSSGDSFNLTNDSIVGTGFTSAGNLANFSFDNNNTGAGITVNGLKVTAQASNTPSSGTNISNILNLAGPGSICGSCNINGITLSGSLTNYLSAANLTIDSSGNITAGGNISAHHYISAGSAPGIGTPSSCGTGTGPSASITSGSTDTAGSFTITAGSTGSPATCDTTITFNVGYGATPNAITLTPKSSTAPAKQIYVSASGSSSFTVTMVTAPANGEANSWYYQVIQ